MNYVRCYPESGWGWCPLDSDDRLFPFKIVQHNPLKFDVSVFNEKYWKNFRQVCQILKEHGIIVHLQLIQQCYFEIFPNPEERWHLNFWNPANDINKVTRNLKPNGHGHHPFIEQPFSGNDKLRSQQRQYLWHILNAVGDLGNVFLDLSNEMGDGGLQVNLAKQWINWVNHEIHQWEQMTGNNILVGMDYALFPDKEWLWKHPDMELIISHGNFLYQDIVNLHRKYGKPVMIVNSVDDGGHILLGRPEMASRFRRFHWRGMMAKAQGLGDYAKETQLNPWDYQQMGKYASVQREFWQTLDYASLLPMPEKIKFSPAKYAYCLSSDHEVVVYLEVSHTKQGVKNSGGKLILSNLPVEGQLHEWTIMHPATGKKQPGGMVIENNQFIISIPTFIDDLVIHGHRK